MLAGQAVQETKGPQVAIQQEGWRRKFCLPNGRAHKILEDTDAHFCRRGEVGPQQDRGT